MLKKNENLRFVLDIEITYSLSRYLWKLRHMN